MEFLKAILGDALYAQVEAKINEHNGKEENKEKPLKLVNLSSGEYTSINKYNDEVTARGNAEQKLSEANALIEQLKSSKPDDTMTQKITEYEGKIQNLENELATAKLDSAISEALRAAKGVDLDYLAFKLKAMDSELKLGDDGKVKGIDEKIATLKTQFPTQFGSSDTKDGKKIVDPQPLPKSDDDKPITKAQFMNMSYEERAALKESNPDAYKAALGQ